MKTAIWIIVVLILIAGAVFYFGWVRIEPETFGVAHSTITGTVDEMYADSGPVRMRLPQNEAEQLGQESIGREVIFGVRPEDIHYPQYVPAGVNGQSIEAVVDVTELMGNEIFVYLIAGDDQNFIARVDPRSDLRPGDKVGIIFNADKIHIFDRVTEKMVATPKA